MAELVEDELPPDEKPEGSDVVWIQIRGWNVEPAVLSIVGP